jgi:hypothetical protein
MTNQMKRIAEATQAMAEDITTDLTFRTVLGYMALGLSYVAAAIAVVPVVIWFGAGQLGRKLIDHGQLR